MPQAVQNLGREVRHIRKAKSETKCLRKLHQGKMNRTNYNWEDQERLVTFEMSLEKIFKDLREREESYHPG